MLVVIRDLNPELPSMPPFKYFPVLANMRTGTPYWCSPMSPQPHTCCGGLLLFWADFSLHSKQLSLSSQSQTFPSWYLPYNSPVFFPVISDGQGSSCCEELWISKQQQRTLPLKVRYTFSLNSYPKGRSWYHSDVQIQKRKPRRTCAIPKGVHETLSQHTNRSLVPTLSFLRKG